MDNSKKKEYLIIGIVITLVVGVIGISYAYWSGSIVGIGKNMSVSIDLGAADVIFTDTQEIVSDEVVPGWEVSKSFSIENKSDETFYYDIYIKDLINTLVTDDFLQYRITSSNGYDMGESYDVLGKSDTAIDYDLATSISIPSKTKQEYTIYIRYYNSPDVDQSADMGKSFSGKLMIRETTGNDVNLISVTVDGKRTTQSYEELVASRPVNSVSCTNGTVGTWNNVAKRILLDEIHVPTHCTIDFKVVPSDYSLYAALTNGKIYSDIKTRSDFNSVVGDATGTTGVIYKEETYKEDGAPVYYFAGNSKDNWVKFAGFYWRIIRTNEDESVRLLYAGTSPDTTSGYIGKSAYNSSYNDTMYVGYKYGSTGSLESNRTNKNNSTIKGVIESWYKTNISNKGYSGYVEEQAVYCNDRSGDNIYIATGIGTMYYAAQKRLDSSKRPTYKCGGNPTNTSLYNDRSNKDKFSVTNEEAKLDYPVGLMTADEVAFAGGKYDSNASYAYYYLNSTGGSVIGSEWWWTMSPYGFYGDSRGAGMFFVSGSRNLGDLRYDAYVYESFGVRPVISLKSSVLVKSGTGTSEDPYTLKMD